MNSPAQKVIPIDPKNVRARARLWRNKQDDSSLAALLMLVGFLCLLAGLIVGFALGQAVTL